MNSIAINELSDIQLMKDAKAQLPGYTPLYTVDRADNKYKVYIYITDIVREPWWYSEIISLLSRLSENDEVHCYIHTDGGYLTSAQLIAHALVMTKAATHAYSVGKVISAGTVIFAACKYYHIFDESTFLFHPARGHAMGKTADVTATSTALQNFVMFLLKKMNQANLITTEEFDKLIKSSADLYISGNTIKTRITQAKEGGEANG